MTSYEAGDVVLVAFPFTNLKATKKRPAVVVSSSRYQAEREDIILMAVTSQVRTPLAFGEALISDWAGSGLLKPSVLKPLLATIEQKRVLKRLGQLGQADRDTLSAILNRMLGC